MHFFYFHSIFSQTPEYFFGNIAFILLFIAVLLYWFDFSDNSGFCSPNESNQSQSFFPYRSAKQWKNSCMIGANGALALLLIVRWFESGHFPLSNLYESLIGLSWGFTTVHLLIILDFTKVLPVFLTDKADCLQSNPPSRVTDLLHSSTSPFLSLSVSAPNPASKAQNIYGATEPMNLDLSCNYDSHPVYTTNQPYLQFFDEVTASDKIGAITAPTALLTSVFATFFLPPEMVRATALIPALKSNWLTMHVTVMVASYAFLLVGSLLSITFCVYRFIIIKKVLPVDSNHFTVTNQLQEIPKAADLFEKEGYNQSRPFGASPLLNKTRKPESFDLLTLQNSNIANKNSKLSNSLDSNVADVCIWLNTMSYRILGLGFPLLTVGILSGAVWANEAWGSYWSWDPKETWALITWLVFAVYFHSRYARNSDLSPVPATIASIGFVTIWICYLGVNLIGTGLHSYGWFVY